MNRQDKIIEYFRYLKDVGENELPIPDMAESGRSSGNTSQSEYEKNKRLELSDYKSKSQRLNEIGNEIKNCQNCALHKSRNNTVQGMGNPDADIMFIGEAPGAEEDRLGLPFVGRAGKLLDKILVAAGLTRDDVFITNILKCRPPDNRDPMPAEQIKCMPFLIRQIEVIEPKIICCLGRISAQGILKTKIALGKLRGQVHSFRGIPLIATYHPAAILRNDNLKRPTWDDFQFMLKTLEKLKEKE
ncbi:uracil-DNA glycosylase [bacterium]|nr:MAG: uracil-DNA glycosylase [bacterium]